MAIFAAALCKSCPAQVFWAETDRGKRMLVDAVPVAKGGNLRVTERDGKAPLATVVAPHLRFGTTLHISHFATCVNARQHRRRGAA